MNVTISELSGAGPTHNLQLVAYGSTLGLYAAATAATTGDDSAAYAAQLSLTAKAVGSGGTPVPGTINWPLLLPVTPQWSLTLSADGTGEMACTSFGGGWNVLNVSNITNAQLNPSYTYGVEDMVAPRFMLNISATAAKQNFVSGIFSGYQFGLIGLQEQDGQQVPHVSGIVGTSEAPVADGRIFGDLSNGLPATATIVYQANKQVGPLAPSGAYCGSLSLASYDINNDKLGTPVDLLPGIEVSDFDIAVGADSLCLFAVTGAGAPLVALYDLSGKATDSAIGPVGSWSNADHWVTSPTVVPSPGGSGFSIAFVEMQDQEPVAVYTGTVTPSTVTP